ncbi:hypothetical protein L195_g030560, partial [Trifolium pratense]
RTVANHNILSRHHTVANHSITNTNKRPIWKICELATNPICGFPPKCRRERIISADTKLVVRRQISSHHPQSEERNNKVKVVVLYVERGGEVEVL